MNATSGALVFIGQVLALAGGAVWFLYGTKVGREFRRDMDKLNADIRARRRQRAYREAAAIWERWVRQMAYWGHIRGQNAPGTPSFELAQDMINALEKLRPPHPGQCPYTGFTCPDLHCPNHPRSHQP